MVDYWKKQAKPEYGVDFSTWGMDEAGDGSLSGSGRQIDDSDPLYRVCYHYVLDGVVYTPYVNLYADDPTVPTITPWYDNADWHEREMQELVGIKVKDQPGKTRLFLDPELDRGIIGKIVPLSVMMNGACTKDLWEHILSAKGGNQ